MLDKKSLLIFPTQRAIREYLENQKHLNTLLPTCLTIDDFLKKSIMFEDKTYCDEEQRVLILNKAVSNINIEALGISKSFTKFLTQSEYIYRFFLEISSEEISIEDISQKDTYEFYAEHLAILNEVFKNYKALLDKNSLIDRVNLSEHYRINDSFLEFYKDVTIYFEGYFTKQEFKIVKEVSKIIRVNIEFYSNIYNQKSLQLFKDLGLNIDLNKKYLLNLRDETIILKNDILELDNFLEIKAFSFRINQIAYIKSSIVSCINRGIKAEKIAIILPDETFARNLELFDNEGYFNFAMGKTIVNSELYMKIEAVYSYILEANQKNIEQLNYLKLDKEFIDVNIKKFWNKICNKEQFLILCDYFKLEEKNIELLEKYDELVYKLKIVLFSEEFSIKLKDIFKIFLQKLSKLSLDDKYSGKVTVMGVLETRLMSFDALIICDFNDEFVPKISTKDKFLSTKIKAFANLPTKYDRENLQKYYYKRIITSSKNIFISFVSSQNSTISRFANELFEDKIPNLTNDKSYIDILYNNNSLIYSDESIKQNIDLTKISWSASSLKKFLKCRRKYYLENILKIKEHKISLLPENYELGSVVHEILEELVNSYDLTRKKVDELLLKHRKDNPFLHLDLEIYRDKLYRFLEFEKQRTGVKIIDLEKQFTSNLNGININGIIDRVDSNGDVYELIDYKTSKNLKIDTLKTYEKSSDFQLEFYYLGAKELYLAQNIKAYYFSLEENCLKEEIALNEKLELLSSIFGDFKELSKKEIDFFKTDDRAVCEFCAFKIACNRQ